MTRESMICIFEHSGLCCNSGSLHYERDCRKCECMIPVSNAERIRSMTDEELAEFLCGVYDEDEDYAKFINGIIIPAYSEQDIENWLKQPYKEDT